MCNPSSHCIGVFPMESIIPPIFHGNLFLSPQHWQGCAWGKKVAAATHWRGVETKPVMRNTHTQHPPPPSNKQPKVQIAVVWLDLTETLVAIVVAFNPFLGLLEFEFPWLGEQMAC